MQFEGIDTPQLTVVYEQDTHYVHVTYRGELTPQITAEFYSWLGQLADLIGIENVHGATIDFRQVTKFHQQNLYTAYRESRSANRTMDMSHIGVGMIVESKQEPMVRLSMNLTGQVERMRIVYSPEEALKFIIEWASGKRTS